MSYTIPTLKFAAQMVANITEHQLETLSHEQLKNLARDMRNSCKEALTNDKTPDADTLDKMYGMLEDAAKQFPALTGESLRQYTACYAALASRFKRP